MACCDDFRKQLLHILCSAGPYWPKNQVPHPLVPKFILRVQTDGDISPKQAVITACNELVRDLGILSREFTKEYELRKMVGTTQQQQNGVSDAI